MSVDVDALEKLINGNTIMVSLQLFHFPHLQIVGSAPNYPYGSVDNIEKLAAIAKVRNM